MPGADTCQARRKPPRTMSKPWAKPCNEGREGENSVRVPSRARSQETRVRATRLAHAGQVPPLRPPLEGRKPSGTHIASSSGKDCFELGKTSGKDSFQPTKPKSSIAICRIVTFPLLPPHPFPLFTPAHPNQGAMSRMDAQGDARSVAGRRARGRMPGAAMCWCCLAPSCCASRSRRRHPIIRAVCRFPWSS